MLMLIDWSCMSTSENTKAVATASRASISSYFLLRFLLALLLLGLDVSSTHDVAEV